MDGPPSRPQEHKSQRVGLHTGQLGRASHAKNAGFAEKRQGPISRWLITPLVSSNHKLILPLV